MLGRRGSSSNNNTRLPACTSAAARLKASVVLPSRAAPRHLDHLGRAVKPCLKERELERAQALPRRRRRALQQVLVQPVLASHRARRARANREATHVAAGLELAGAAHAAAETIHQEGQQRARQEEPIDPNIGQRTPEPRSMPLSLKSCCVRSSGVAHSDRLEII